MFKHLISKIVPCGKKYDQKTICMHGLSRGILEIKGIKAA
jgi:hypothetical protein